MSKVIQDILSARFLLLTILPFFIILFISFAFLIPAIGDFFTLLADPNLAQDPELPSFIAFLIGFSFIQWLLAILAGILGTGIAILFSFMLSAIIAGFMTPYIVSVIHKKHYAHIQRDEVSTMELMGLLLAVFLKFLLYLVIALLALLVPFVGLVIFYLPFYYFFYKMLFIDVGGSIDTKQSLLQMEQKHKKEFMITTFAFFFISNIPFLGIFLQVPFVITLTHQYFLKKDANQPHHTNIQ